jgi:hypothetical protein
MTLEELYIEEPWVKDLFKNTDINSRKDMKHIHGKIIDWTFIDGNPLKECSTDEINIMKLNTFFKYLPDNSSLYLFISAIRSTYMKRELLEEWIPLLNRSYRIFSEKGWPEVDFEFQGLLEYIEK